MFLRNFLVTISLLVFFAHSPASAASMLQGDAGDIASPLLLLLAGVIVGGVISAVRTHASRRASK